MNIEERLAELERKNRRLTFALVFAGGTVAMLAALALAGCMAPAGKAPLERITARMFSLVDADGEGRASLSVADNCPVLSLSDEKGEGGVTLAVTEDGPALILSDEKGEGRASLGICDNCPALTLLDEKGNIRASLDVVKNAPVLSLHDEKSKTIWRTP